MPLGFLMPHFQLFDRLQRVTDTMVANAEASRKPPKAHTHGKRVASFPGVRV